MCKIKNVGAPYEGIIIYNLIIGAFLDQLEISVIRSIESSTI